MFNERCFKIYMLGLLLTLSVVRVESASIKYSFESGDFSNWKTEGQKWSIYKRSATDGTKSAMCTLSKGSAPGVQACIVGIKDANPGWVLVAKLDVSGKVKSNSSKLNLTLICVDVAGNTLREVKKTIVAPSAEFQTVVLPELDVPSGTTEAYFMIGVEVTQPPSSKEWWRFDNVVLQVK